MFVIAYYSFKTSFTHLAKFDFSHNFSIYNQAINKQKHLMPTQPSSASSLPFFPVPVIPFF